MTDKTLPIEALNEGFDAALSAGPVVVSAPTGSGKSTIIPQWCARRGKVLVVEPRRVACRSLAQRVAQLMGAELGGRVGYTVRDERRASARTELLFATTGVVLQRLARGDINDITTVIIDEFHERSLDIDLILALLLQRPPPHLVIMSATIAGDAVARFVGGVHVQGEGRAFPVATHHIGPHDSLPGIKGLESRVGEALSRAQGDWGDVLVFLPGKGEIASVAAALSKRGDVDIIPLHGGLSLSEQGRAFAPSAKRKVILATNVAETSITLPGVGVVIDSGLVRQTRYHQGRGYLGVVPIAMDSADQRAGRAGRTAPGVCYRLWGTAAILAQRTLPEVYRESLTPLVLGAAACHSRASALRFPDPPKAHALEEAEGDLIALGALDDDGALTARGQALFGLPMDAHLGRLLIEAKERGTLADAIDLVAALSVGRPLFRSGPRPEDEGDDLRARGCDVEAAIRAVRIGEPRRHHLIPFTVEEARRISQRLRKLFGLPLAHQGDDRPDRRALAMTALAADPRMALIPRRRKREVAWAGGGTELRLARESAVHEEKAEALLAMETRAFGAGYRDARLLITCAMPIPLKLLARAELGELTVGRISVERGQILAKIERRFAGKIIDSDTAPPTGALAREALLRLFLDGRVFKKALRLSKERLQAAALFNQLRRHDEVDPPLWPMPWEDGAHIPTLEDWAAARIAELGVESGEDLALLSETDFLAPPLPEPLIEKLDRTHPRSLTFGDAQYRIDYDLGRRQVTLVRIKGDRKDPPPLSYLPAFRGFKILVQHKQVVKVLRGRSSSP